ncbi:DNA polymerase III subunit beta [Candidatus Blochmannia ocreatus (nom. nud.)]|uniref:Beta sliding clamp n=1 Tax=Candidatus Blochmannia ocreatus (nom. nud.) TaxID=251538 RepID=A0ABY4SVT3_9ENTR|nr:DNA polymerase III subunit beta [Candidatus Blochmannia ocreatus]URJ25110.1 DNA polymerase III subunit beta [Candidatus Blochmannia ocreatus]
MNFVINKKCLYKSLQKVIAIVASRPRIPILTHILLEVSRNHLFITATDLEIEIIAYLMLEQEYPCPFRVTVSGRKFFEICRSFPESAKISITLKDERLMICSGTSKFSLSTLCAEDFPKSDEWKDGVKLTISQLSLKKMIELTQFSMGSQDARYYLNGIFFKTAKDSVRIVATDGHRLATCKTSVSGVLSEQSIIIPRKGIVEILRLLTMQEKLVDIYFNKTSVRIKIDNYVFTSKLIDAVFPNCCDIFLKKQSRNVLEITCEVLRHALKRVAILANEKLRIIQFVLMKNQLKITSYNFSHETSEEILDVSYCGENMEVFFNVDYLLNILNVMLDQEILRFFLTDSISSVQIESASRIYAATYIVMPVRT